MSLYCNNVCKGVLLLFCLPSFWFIRILGKHSNIQSVDGIWKLCFQASSSSICGCYCIEIRECFEECAKQKQMYNVIASLLLDLLEWLKPNLTSLGFSNPRSAMFQLEALTKEIQLLSMFVLFACSSYGLVPNFLWFPILQ